MAKIEYVPPGHDPTTEEYTPEGPNCRGCLLSVVGVIALLGIGGFFVIFSHAKQSEKPLMPVPVVMPSDTPTSLPTSTGTVTPVPPTETMKPSPTIRPSNTATPTLPPKLVITATQALEPITYITATNILDPRVYWTLTPDTRSYTVKRQAQIKEATATAVRKTFEAQHRPTETPVG